MSEQFLKACLLYISFVILVFAFYIMEKMRRKQSSKAKFLEKYS
jgi:hypothetical protein